ncbi:GUN4 N-terminal ARM-like repeat domain-containing protein [Roseofilum casamattae]|uniref:GUN4 N-terminal ARM-like repeat domain-containing protein n=1 Tax=Roseofilum casamattae BLCC-M143 TaxID=3022442 RepID=A0ABT7BWP3_9CYAN|nr:GUN4 domain-containing protein [Roseofilum casamattae]MDJ1183586.1 GUN4 N-terminal ARM-like repeat domain-containing protein [Roseofilum casamattae BLCC-M143]
MPELTDLEQLAALLSSSTAKAQLKTIDTLSTLGTSGETVLMEFLSGADNAPIWVKGKAFLILKASESPQVQEFLQRHYPQGIVALNSDRDIDYSSLQELLMVQKFQEADRLTLLKMCELAGESAIGRKWLYFSEVNRFPRTDLRTIDTLWLAYSEGKFGFSVQRELWLGVGKNWEKLWPKIQWRTGKTWTRYPNEFIWDVSAPRGHLPLSNQLRGVRVMDSLLSHPVWNE